MNRAAVFCLLLTLLLGFALSARPAPAGPAPRAEYAADSVLVAFKSAAPLSARLSAVNRYELAVDPQEQNPYFAVVKLGAAAAAAGPGGSSAAIKQVLAALRRDPNVRVAEPNYLRHAFSVPNDPRFNELWGLRNTGQLGGTPGADINATGAWDISTGSDSVIVAVIDTGVDTTHPDLKDNILRDAHGAVIGYDFRNSDANPADDNGHGTHVAGTIGARGNNGVGVVGVCQRVKIMPLKFLDGSGNGSDANAIRAMDFAREHGAKVMSNSWGGGGRSQLMLEAIRRARDSGILFVAAAGNETANNDTSSNYPANYNSESSNVLSVAATDRGDRLADFSNFGVRSVDLAAPGVGILSCKPGGGYQTLSGTSMATPHVSGAAALLLARSPDLPLEQLKARLLNDAVALPSLSGKIHGGRLNVFRALGAASDVTPPAAAGSFEASLRSSRALLLRWIAPGDDGFGGTASRYELKYGTSPIDDGSFTAAATATGLPDPAPGGTQQSYLLTSLVPGRAYYVALRAVDDAGNASPLVVAGAYTTTLSGPQICPLQDFVEGALQFTGDSPWAPTIETSVSPDHSYTDSPSQDYADDANLSLISNAAVTLSGFFPTLQYQARWALEDGYDFVHVELSNTGGATWKEVDLLTGASDWALRVVSLAPYYRENVRIRFRLESDDSLSDQGVWLDDIQVCGEQLVATDPPIVTLPAAPTGLKAEAASPSEIDLSWTDRSANETAFRLERKTGTGAYTLLKTLPANSQAYVDKGLAAGTRYAYRLAATNSAGSSGALAVTATTLSAPPASAVPAAPAQLAAEPQSDTAIRLSWADRSGNESSFKLERRSGGAAFAFVKALASNSTSYTDTGLSPATAYTYRLSSSNAAGDSPPVTATATTLPAVRGMLDVARSVKFPKTRSGKVRTKTLVIQNLSPSERLSVTVGTLSRPFSLTEGTSTVLPPKGRLTLTVRFTAHGHGIRRASLVLRSSDPANASVTVAVQGTSH